MTRAQENKNKYSLNLTSKEAVSHMISLANLIELNYQKYGASVFIELVDGYSAMYSFMRYSFDKHAKIVIGIDDIIKLNVIGQLSDRTLVKDNDFVKTLIAFFHEDRHARNVIKGFRDCRDNKKDDYYLAINCLACKDNSEYYTLNYDNLPYEIDAEQFAIMSTYSFLRNEFPNCNYEQLILNYVNERCENGDYKIKPIDGGYKTIKSVNTAFNNVFEESKYIERFFNIQSTDEVSRFLKDNDKWFDITRKIEKMNEFNDDFKDIGLKRDEMLSSISLFLHPEYKSNMHIFQSNSLSSSKVFGVSDFPPKTDFILDEYYDHDDERE